MADEKPIIIIKKGGHGHGHHGGAWKVAYADFVTAMMAFFMVMWLVNSADVTTKKAIALYFRKPGIFETGSGTPMFEGGSGLLPDGFLPAHPEDNNYTFGRSMDIREGVTDQEGGDIKSMKSKDRDGKQGIIESTKADPRNLGGMGDAVKGLKPEEVLRAQKEQMGEVVQVLKEQLAGTGKDGKTNFANMLGAIEIKMTGDGLIIDIMDTDKTSMFRSGSSNILPEAEESFRKIARAIRVLPNKIDIIGHTDSKPFRRGAPFSNWELSADRANAARRILEEEGLTGDQFGGIIGRADKELKNKEKPLDPINRRITLKIQFEGLNFDANKKEQEGQAITPDQIATPKQIIDLSDKKETLEKVLGETKNAEILRQEERPNADKAIAIPEAPRRDQTRVEERTENLLFPEVPVISGTSGW